MKQTISFVGHEWHLAVTRNMSFWHQWISGEGHVKYMSLFGVHAALEELFISVDGTSTSVFVYEPNYTEYCKAVLEAINTKRKVAQLKKVYQKLSLDLLRTLSACVQDTTVHTWNSFVEAYRQLCPGLMITTTIGRDGGEQLSAKLKDLGIPEAEIQPTIALITYPKEYTPLTQSQLDLLGIGSQVQAHTLKGQSLKNKLKRWVTTHGMIPVNFCNEPWGMEDAQQQLSELLKKDCKAELGRIGHGQREMLQDARKRLREIGDADVEILAMAIAEGTSLNEFRKNVFSRVSLGFRPIFKRIAAEAGSGEWRDCFYLTCKEMEDILKGNPLDIQHIVQQRKICGGLVDAQGQSSFLEPGLTEKLYVYVQQVHKSTTDMNMTDSVKGLGASKGKVRGIVKVILNATEFHKMNEGDILVTAMTSVDFVPIMERAAAFVTNEGGITSHASIVAREMKKPCIIGTKNATQVLKDGDFVEVDADNGIVRKIR